MQIILYRGKTKKGEWVKGAFYRQQNFYGEKQVKDCIITSNGVLSDDLGLDYEIVIPKTVSRYLGIKDINKNEIFVGDIIKANHNAYCYKVYEEDNRVYIEDFCGNAIKPTQQAIDLFDCEVVGNIFDNEELLEKRYV